MRLRYQDVIHKFLYKFNPKSKTSHFSWYCWKQEKAETKLWLLCELEFYGSCRLKIKCKRRESPQSVLKLWILGMDGEGGIKAQQSVPIERSPGAIRPTWLLHPMCGSVCVRVLFVCLFHECSGLPWVALLLWFGASFVTTSASLDSESGCVGALLDIYYIVPFHHYESSWRSQ